MIYKAILASTLALSTSAASAQVTGGYLGAEVLSYNEDGIDASVSYSGGLEYAFNRNWSIAANLEGFDQGLLSNAGGNLTLHVMYHLNEEATIGLFRGADALDGDVTATGQGLTGIEAGYEIGKIEGEGFFAIYDDEEGADYIEELSGATLVGASGEYAITDQISATAAFGFLSSDTEDASSFSAGASYTFVAGPSLYAEVGQTSVGDEDSTFIGIGANVAFGADRGTTFDIRSAFDSVRSGF